MRGRLDCCLAFIVIAIKLHLRPTVSHQCRSHLFIFALVRQVSLYCDLNAHPRLPASQKREQISCKMREFLTRYQNKKLLFSRDLHVRVACDSMTAHRAVLYFTELSFYLYYLPVQPLILKYALTPYIPTVAGVLLRTDLIPQIEKLQPQNVKCNLRTPIATSERQMQPQIANCNLRTSNAT